MTIETPSSAGRAGAVRAPYLLLALSSLFWSGNVVIGRGMSEVLPPVALSFWRWSFALVLLLALFGRALWRERFVLVRNGRLVLTLALVSVATYNPIFYMALHWTTAINSAVVYAAAPVIIAAMAWLVVGERVTPRQMAGIAVSLAGVLIVVTRGRLGSLATLGVNLGDALVLFTVLQWGFYSVLLRRVPPGVEAGALFTAIVLVGVAWLVPMWLVEWALGARFPVTVESAATVAYVAVFPSVLAILFWNKAVIAVGPTRAGNTLHLGLVFSTALAVLLLGERIALFQLSGAALILAGIYLSSTRGKSGAGR